MMLVFFRLMVRENSQHASAKHEMRASSECMVRWASSAKSIYLISTRCTFVFALRRDRLNKLPSLLVWRKIPSSDSWRA
jgi:hypothetical protein